MRKTDNKILLISLLPSIIFVTITAAVTLSISNGLQVNKAWAIVLSVNITTMLLVTGMFIETLGVKK